MSKLYSSTLLGSIKLANRIVMAPMTRSRAVGGVPNDLMVKYYEQRASAGLIITEGTSPSVNGLGYARIPGIYTTQQVDAWKKVTSAVHAKGGKIFMQVMHCGRIAHPENLPAGGRLIAPSAIPAKGQMWTDKGGMQDMTMPHEMSKADIKQAVEEFARSAELAVTAGFDGVEIHGANGYLIDQFVNPRSNQRTDDYGGSSDSRLRFALEVTAAVSERISPSRVGFRVSPYNSFNDLQDTYEGQDQVYATLAARLSGLGIAYLHSICPPASANAVKLMRENFKGALMLNGGYEAKRAEVDLSSGLADLISFGRPFISNPNLPAKLKEGATLVPADPNMFYTADEKGYTDYV